jgi:hypothetical protein
MVRVVMVTASLAESSVRRSRGAIDSKISCSPEKEHNNPPLHVDACHPRKDKKNQVLRCPKTNVFAESQWINSFILPIICQRRSMIYMSVWCDDHIERKKTLTKVS